MDTKIMPILKEDFYVYCHQTKDDGKCFYIGKGRGRRAYIKDKRNPHWKNKVKKHGGFDAVILVNNITEEKAFELEKDFIKQIGRENLVNMTDGGEGMTGRFGDKNPMWRKSPSEETRKKQSEARIGKYTGENNPNYGKSPSKETRSKMGRLGKDSGRAKSVNQYTKGGVFIKTWYSIMDIKRELMINNSHISQCCLGKRKSAGGYIWRCADTNQFQNTL